VLLNHALGGRILIGRMGIPSIGLPMVAIEEGSGGFALEEVRAWDAPRSNHGRISQGDTILIWYIRDKPKGKCTCTPQVWAQYCRAAETHALLPAAPLTHTRLLLHQSSSAYPPPPPQYAVSLDPSRCIHAKRMAPHSATQLWGGVLPR